MSAVGVGQGDRVAIVDICRQSHNLWAARRSLFLGFASGTPIDQRCGSIAEISCAL
jgi:hypothetical protein